MANSLIINPNFQDGDGGAITGITANTNFGTPANWTKSGTGFSRSGHVIPHGAITIPKYGTHCLVLGEDRTPNSSGTEVINADTQAYSQSFDFTYLSFLRIAFEAHNFTDSSLYFELKWGTTFFYTVGTANFSFQGTVNKNYAEHIAVPSSAPSGNQALNINLRNALTGTREKPSIYIAHVHPVRMPRFGSMRWCDTNLMKTAYDADSTKLTVSHGTASKGNLVDNAVNKTWTSGSVAAGTDITVSIDLSTAQFVNFAAIINHNCPTPASVISATPDTYYLEGSATSNFNAGSPEVSFPFRFKSGNMYIETNNNPFEYRYWRIRLDADSVTAHNISIGEIVIGLNKEILTNYAWEHSILSSYKNNVYETQWGEKFTYQRHRQDSYHLSFNDIRDSTMFQMQALLTDTLYGATNPLVLIPDPRKRECLFGRFQNEINQQILYKDYNRTDLIFTTEPIGVQLTA